ncbi:PAS domain S-box protein [Flagellimonas halotolerans]|uniref:histidine kinase n=1 Tax=Flagellimonas halotolerans TaxID=3112164 RepID=A0ABU6ISI9_9FLAO|nr:MULTISPECIES: PAS domain S-box protein [unclassified Allomuricauda]MEC3966221.1 PAS domain S-box protein [Muricauda sp. SYSU M86414]MEC4266093.1 PAS domain S-box protein [Muricauda sp. SYSU M84420]
MGSEKNLSNLFYLNPLPSWIYDRKTFQILEVNQAAMDHYGYTQKEFMGLTLKELQPKQEIPHLLEANERIGQSEGNFYFGIFTHQKKSGELVRMEINGHILDFDDKPCILVVCHDITEKENQLIRLQESEARLKTASSIAKLGYWSLDMEDGTLSWSDEVYVIWGVNKETFELTYQNFFNSIHPDDQEVFEEEQRISSSGERPHDFVHRIICPDKSVRWVHELGRLIKDEQGNPIVFEGTVQDITTIKEHEQQHKLLESVVTNTNDAVLITEAEPFDEPGPRILYVNEAFTKLTGYGAEEVIGKTPRILQGPKTDREELGKLGRSLRNWESCEATMINYKKNGEEFWIHLSITPVANEKGWYTHWIAIERDVTTQKNKALEQELIAEVSRSFNTTPDIPATVNRLCSSIKQFGDFLFVELWALNLENSLLRQLGHQTKDDSVEGFYKGTPTRDTLKKGEGLPGMVWAGEKRILWSGREVDRHFVRQAAAKTIGLKSILGLPLMHGNTVVGVLVIGSQLERTSLRRYVEILDHLKAQLGSELYRKQLESDLGQMLDTLPDIVCITDLEGRFLKINKAFCELTGYEEEEILNVSYHRFVHPDDVAASNADLESLTKGHRTLGFENRYITKSGDVLWLSWTSRASVREQIVYATAKNITEQKKLRELNQMAGKLAKIGGWEVDLINGEVYWSEIVHRLHETDPESFRPDLETAIDFYHPEYRGMVKDYVDRSIRTGEGFDFEAILITTKQKERWVRVIGNVNMGNGRAVLMYGSFQDIHERKIAEQRLQSITDDLPGVAFQYVIRPDGTDSMQSVSRASSRIWKLKPSECEADNELVWEQIKKGGDWEEVNNSIAQSIETGEKWNFRWRNVLPSGELRWHEGFGTPNAMADGSVVFNSLIFDITEEKRATLLYEETAQLARMGSWEVNLSDKKVFFSKITREIHEMDKAVQLELDQAIDFYHQDHRDFVKNEIARGIASDNPWEIEAPIITLKGNERWIKAIGQVEKVEGVPIRIYGSIQDIHKRKLTELRLQSITNDLPGVVFQYHLYPDGSDRLLSVSESAHDIWHISPGHCEQNIDLVWDQIRNGGDFDTVVKDINESIAGKSKWHSVWRNILPNGEQRWHEGYGTPSFLPDGTVVFNSMVFDVTEKRKAVNLYNEASNLAKIGSWELVLDQGGTDEMFWSPMLREILEVDEDYNPSLTGGFEFYEENSKMQIQEAVSNLIETGEVFDLELQVKTAQNHVKWVRCIGKAEFVNGRCERIFGSYQDIDERKTAEIQLKTMTDNMPGVVFQYLRLGEGMDRILYISEGSRRIWGMTPDECREHPEKIWSQIAAGGDMDKVVESIDESAKNLSTWNASWWNQSPQGDRRYYQGIGTPQELPDGAILWNSLILDITDQKIFEQNYLREQAERVEVLESISDAFYALDEHWNFRYYNKQAELLLEKSSREVLGKNIWKVFSPAKNTELETVYKRVSRSGKPESFEYLYPGDNCWYEINVYSGNNGISAYFKNIDERRKAKRELEKAYLEKETILESIGDAFFSVDTDWVVKYWNKEAEKVLGKKREEIIGKNLWEEYDDAIDSDFYSQYHKAKDTGKSVSFEEYYPALDSWFEVSAYPSEDGISVYFKDVTLRKKADIRLKRANERFEKVAQATNDAIWDFDIKENTLFWGDGFEKLFGYEVEKITPTLKSWTDHIHPDDKERVLESLDDALKSQQSTWTGEYRYQKSNGDFAFVVDRGIVIRNVKGDPIRMVGAITDITERKENEQQLFELNRSLENYTKELERSNEELEQFAFVTSHDLQEPLRMVSSFMDQLKRKYGDQLDEKAHQYIHYAIDGAKRMKRIILDLLEYSRANSPSSEKEAVDLNLLMEDYGHLRRKTLNETSAVITFEQLPIVTANPSSLTQILYNLLDNAIKYVEEGRRPEISLTVRDRTEHWEFCVDDNGIGIKPQFFNKIFLIFQRLHNDEAYEGTGMGLSIVKKQVEHLGGEIWLESEPGKGSTFYFTIPK